MTIDKDTPLEEILDSSEVGEIITDLQTTLINKLSSRSSALDGAISSGLDQSVLIDGESLFYNSAINTKQMIDGVNEEINGAFNTAKTLSEEKETEELTTLKELVNAYINELDTKIENLRAEFRNITSDSSFDDKTASEKATIYGTYYGSDGSIALAGLERSLYQEKLEAIIKRLNKVNPWNTYEDAAAAGYSGVMTRNEFLRRKAAGSEPLNEFESYEDYLAAMQDRYLGVTYNDDTWTSYEDAASDGHPEVMTKAEFESRKALDAESVKGFATYNDYLAAMQEQYEGKEAAESVATESGPDFANTIPEDAWVRQPIYTKVGSTVMCEETRDSEGNIVSRTSSKDGKVLYYNVYKDKQSYFYDINRNEITTGTALAMTSVENFGKVESEQWQRVDTATDSSTNTYVLQSNYKNMEIELVTNTNDEPLYFTTTNENGEVVYYDGNYNKITSDQAQELLG